MDDGLYRMPLWGEVQGSINKVEDVEGYCLALIGKIPVLLPLEMTKRLKEVQGKRVSLLRTDFDYRFRIL